MIIPFLLGKHAPGEEILRGGEQPQASFSGKRANARKKCSGMECNEYKENPKTKSPNTLLYPVLSVTICPLIGRVNDSTGDPSVPSYSSWVQGWVAPGFFPMMPDPDSHRRRTLSAGADP